MDSGLRFSRGVALLGASLWLISLWKLGLTVPPLAGLLALSAVAVYGERRALYVPGYGALNLGESLYFAAAVAWGPVLGAGLTALLGLASDTLNAKKFVVKVFNLGWSLCTFTAVGWAARGGGGPALVLGTLVYALLAGWLQAVAQHHFELMPMRRTLAMQLQGMTLQAPCVLCLGGLATLLLLQAPWSVLMMAFPVEIASAYVRIRALHRELQEAQSRLLASGRQAALGVMSAGVAHELNNPLGAMATALHVLKSVVEREGVEKARAPLGIVEKALERCHGVTRRMLAYARPPGRARARSLPEEVVRDTLAFADSRLSGVRLETRLEELPAVACEPGELIQVLTNLVTNALDAMEGRTDPRLSLTGTREGPEVVLRVQDNGPGVPAEARSHIFEPFFTTRPVGTGLGLSISQGIARAAGGSLTLEGTNCFVLRLPLVEQD